TTKNGSLATTHSPLAFHPHLSAALSLAFRASSSLFRGVAVVSNSPINFNDTLAISSTAHANEASFAFDGLLNPVIFRTNCSDAARTSSSVTGGSKLNNVLIFLHMVTTSHKNPTLSTSTRPLHNLHTLDIPMTPPTPRLPTLILTATTGAL